MDKKPLLIIGWKAIAQVLGVTDRTARNWHQDPRIGPLPIVYRGRTPTTTLPRLEKWVSRKA